MGVLTQILAAKREEVETLRGHALPPAPARRQIALQREVQEPLRLIAEIKHRSPSAGELSRALSVGARAQCYERAGAAMLSVLADTQFFGGSYGDLSLAREATELPILCKEFVIDAVQLEHARAFGADAVLLIVKILRPDQVRKLVSAARAIDLEPLVEIATHDEARIALDAGAEFVGVNARDLDTLQMDAERAARVLRSLPSWVCAVHLSGLATASDVGRVARSTAHAALVGETLMRQDDPEALLSEFIRASSA